MDNVIEISTEQAKNLLKISSEKNASIDNLPVELKEEVLRIKDSINLSESITITSYGSDCQKNISELSDQILSNVKTKDVGEVGNLLTELIKTIQETDVKSLSGETNFFMKLFTKIKDPINSFMIKNENLSDNIKKVSKDLIYQRDTLIESVNTLDQLFETSRVYFEDLQKYIMAGRIKIQEETIKLELLKKTAEETNFLEDVQAYEDLKRSIDRFEKRLHDMELTKEVIFLQAPQIRQMQSNNEMLIAEIDNSVVNAIPAWQQSIVMAVEGYRANKGMEMQLGLRRVLNKSLENTSSMLKDTTIEVAKMNQRGLIDISTIETMQKNLLEGATKAKLLAKETRERAKEESKKLLSMEANYKKKLLNV